MFNSIINESLTPIIFLTCMVVSVVLGLVVALVHQKTTDRNNKNFMTTLALLPALVSIVILLVNGNLGAGVAVAGAFSLIRFRSIPGTSKEILSVFFAMAIGLTCGMGYVGFAIIFTLFVSIILILLDALKFGDNKNDNKILKIVIPEDCDYEALFDREFSKYLEKFELYQTKTTNMGSMFELTYLINEKHNISEKDFIDELRIKNGNLKVSISHPIEDRDSL